MQNKEKEFILAHGSGGTAHQGMAAGTAPVCGFGKLLALISAYQEAEKGEMLTLSWFPLFSFISLDSQPMGWFLPKFIVR